MYWASAYPANATTITAARAILAYLPICCVLLSGFSMGLVRSGQLPRSRRYRASALGSHTSSQFLVVPRETEQPAAKRPDRLRLSHPAELDGTIAVHRCPVTRGGFDISDDPKGLHADPLIA